MANNFRPGDLQTVAKGVLAARNESAADNIQNISQTFVAIADALEIVLRYFTAEYFTAEATKEKENI